MPLHRRPEPIVTPQDIPALRPDLRDVSSVFNPGAVRWRGRELLLLRVQTRGRTTVLLPAERFEGDRIEVIGPPLDFAGLGLAGRGVDPLPAHIYDPRLTVLEDTLVAVCACDVASACHLLTLRTTDFQHWDVLSYEDRVDQRNGVLFPERIDGHYLRLQRPNRVRRDGAPPSGSTITLARSIDLQHWEQEGVVLEGRPQRWDELIGSGPPPVKTREGWLHLYHGVATHFAAANLYQAGVVLLDLENPQRVVARGAFNILEPRTPWERTGQVPNVVFPSGLVVEEIDDEGFAAPDTRLRVYYGAADTVIGLATATVTELLADARFRG